MVEHAHIEGHVRIARLEGGDRPGQEIEGDRLTAREAHRAAPQALEILDPRLDPFDLRVLLADVANEDFAGGCQAHAARPSLQKRGAQLLLQIHDAPVDRRGRDVEALRGGADRTHAGDFVEIIQNSQMAHGQPPAPVKLFWRHSMRKSASKRATEIRAAAYPLLRRWRRRAFSAAKPETVAADAARPPACPNSNRTSPEKAAPAPQG